MIFSSEAQALWHALNEQCQSVLAPYEVKESKTQLSLCSGCVFGCVSMPRSRKQGGIVVTFGLPTKVESSRIWQAAEPYPQRWTHHVIVKSVKEIDAELISWLAAAQAFAQTKPKR